MRFKELVQEYQECTRCQLHMRRSNVVHGYGNTEAKLFMVGEAPGEQEDQKGFPFVGPAGRRLNMMLKDVGILREDVWSTNTVMCRPIKDENDNRVPTEWEMKSCSRRLHEELLRVDPDLIWILGATAVRGLVGKAAGKMDNIVGDLVEVKVPVPGTGIVARFPAMVLHHPSYLLRVDPDWDESGASRRSTDLMRFSLRILDYLEQLRYDPKAALAHEIDLPDRGEDIFLRKEL